ncbi:MAG TPA: phage tail sheath subtilisin-like domain-containing protein [bacterium]|nr:phage tail sheath subtilisin-like domain-containing protein [bacterium]
MNGLRTPGVYIREVEVPTPVGVRMDITGFIGQAERGPVNFPQPLTSWGQFLEIFGSFSGTGYLPYTVFAFFANGGRVCRIVRVAHEDAAAAQQILNNKDNQQSIQVVAINAGNWGNDLEITVESTSTEDMVLAMVTQELKQGDATVTLSTVAGFYGSVNPADADTITLIHPTRPYLQEVLRVKSVDYDQKKVTFHQAVSRDFPRETNVLGKGFRFVARYLKEGKLIRGEVYDNLSMDESHDRNFMRVINGDPEETDYVGRLEQGQSILVRVADVWQGGTTAPPRIEDTVVWLENGSDGQPDTLEAKHYTGYENGDYYTNPPTTERPGVDELEGLATLEAVQEVGLIAIPDLMIPDFYQIARDRSIPLADEGIIFTDVPREEITYDHLKTGQTEMLFHCQKMGDRFALLDSPPGAEVGTGKNRIEDWPNNYQLLPGAKNGALYFPWMIQRPADFDELEFMLPPCGHLTGVFARTEQERGVGKAPANEELIGAVELEYNINDADQALLNPRGVNCLRVFPGRGLRIWGARTLSREATTRYVNIRRVTLAIIKNILMNLQWTVFEPNDRQLWDKITATLSRQLRELFFRGLLAGETPEEAFFVKCDEETNPPEVIDSGQVITEVGFAPARPAEFILVTIKRTPQSLSVVER